MKTKVICGLAILAVILCSIIVLCAFSSRENTNNDGVLVVVSEYYADDAQQNTPEADIKENTIKEHLDGSQKFEFTEE